jgi:hypothetical protein
MITREMINKIDHEKQRLRKETYTKIYEQFSRQIQLAVTANQKHVFLQVPSFLFGHMAFNQANAALYLKRQFTRAGFDVTDFTDTSFIVSWYSPATKKIQEEASNRPYDNHESPEIPTEGLPSLINLKKAANRYRK